MAGGAGAFKTIVPHAADFPAPRLVVGFPFVSAGTLTADFRPLRR